MSTTYPPITIPSLNLTLTTNSNLKWESTKENTTYTVMKMQGYYDVLIYVRQDGFPSEHISFATNQRFELEFRSHPRDKEMLDKLWKVTKEAEEIYNHLANMSEPRQAILQQLVDKLNSKFNSLKPQYRDPIPKEIIQEAKDNNIVILYGASDDLAVFEGAIEDEVGCYEGGVIATNPEIKALWYKTKDLAWQYKTEIPHKKFTIWEGLNVYCEGIVFFKPEGIKLSNGE